MESVVITFPMLIKVDQFQTAFCKMSVTKLKFLARVNNGRSRPPASEGRLRAGTVSFVSGNARSADEERTVHGRMDQSVSTKN